MAAKREHPIESKASELALLRIALLDPVHFNEFIKLSPLAFPSYRKLAHQLQQFWEEFHTAPEQDTFRAWCRVPEALDQFAAVLRETAPAPKQAHVYAEMLRRGMLARGMLELAEYLADTVGKKPHHDVLRSAQQRLGEAALSSSLRASVTRNWYWRAALDRAKRYKELKEHPERTLGIRFGIPTIDSATGGLHAFKGEADLVAIFGKPGAYKSRLMINMAYNQAKKDIPVLFVSREMSAERVGLLLDVRESLVPDLKGGIERLEYGVLQQGYLEGRYQRRYQNLLKTLYTERNYPLWIVDCPDIITTGELAGEIEIFNAEYGGMPKVIYLDYANLIDPVGHYDHEAQKMDRIFLELLGIIKGYGIPMVTAVRESRGGSLKREREDIGAEHIGLSQAIGYHVHQLWHLDQDEEDVVRNRLQVRAKKNRYGALFNVSLFVRPEHNYVGERELGMQDGFADQL